MVEKVTVFQSKKTQNKHPISPYDDNTFVFITYEAKTNLELFSVLVSHFILNIPLHKQEKPMRTFRRKENLERFYGDCVSYVVLDIDNVKSEQNKQKILDYFKDYKVILGESKSYNGIDNFNMKGILFTECLEINDVKGLLSFIHHELKDYCTIDESAGRRASLNAPIGKNSIFINNEDGKRFVYDSDKSEEKINEIKSDYINKTKKFKLEDLENIEADTIEKFCIKTFQMLGFEAIKNNPNGSITFKHPNEEKTPGGYFWFSNSPYTMHHGNSTKTINIFDTVRKVSAAKELMDADLNYDDELLRFNTDTNVISVNEKYLSVTDEIKTTVEKFLHEKDGLLSIRSPMGTGKSTIINHIIEECHEQDMRVLIVTNRISVAQDFVKKYDIKIYNKDKYNYGDSLICQFDSLWRYKINNFDIVIMDEFISLMTYSRSSMTKNTQSITKFFACFNKKLVIADAFLTGYENFLLSDKKNNLHLIDNNYRDPTLMYMYEDFNFFIQSILTHAEKNKVTISSTSLGFIDGMTLLLKKHGLNVVTLTKDAKPSTKELIYKLFEEDEHGFWDVLIYSPTLTVGVSNLNSVPYHFHYDSSKSADVISSIQMIKRTRRAREIHINIKDRIDYSKNASYDRIRDEYMGNIGKHMSQNYLFDIDDYGEARLSSIGKKALKIDAFSNILEFNHKKAMLWIMKYNFMKDPIIVKNTFEHNVLTKYQKMIKNDKQVLLESKVSEYLNLNEIEKTNVIMDSDADKTLKTLALIDSEIKECPPAIKTKILECALKDSGFIVKAKYFKVVFNYTKKIWDESDVKALVSQCALESKNDDLHFYNTLLSYGQKEIFDDYERKFINKNSKLKYILDKCGYRFETSKNMSIAGQRSYVVDKNVKEFYGFIR